MGQGILLARAARGVVSIKGNSFAMPATDEASESTATGHDGELMKMRKE